MDFITAKTSTVLQERYRGGSPVASVYSASFTQVLIGCLYAIALPNVLIFKMHLSPGFLGVLGAIGAFAYILGPVLFKKCSSNAGTKKALIDIAILESVTMTIAIAFLSPVVLVVTSMLEGMLASMYWTNMNFLVSKWQAIVPRSKQAEIFKKYGMSWNLGGIAGEIAGFLVIFAGLDDYVVCLVSLGLEALHLYLLRAIICPGSETRKVEARGMRDSSSLMTKRDGHAIRRYLFAAVLLMIVGELCLQVTKSTYDFLFPFIVFENDASSSVVYVMSLFQQLAQMSGIYASSKLNERGQYRGAIAAIGTTLVLTACVLVAPAMLMISAALIIVGFAGGLIYGFTAQVMLCCNRIGSMTRLTSLYESFSGTGDGVMVMITGFTSETGFTTAFMVLEWYLAATLVVFLAAAIRIRDIIKKLIKMALPGQIMRRLVVPDHANVVVSSYFSARASSSMNMLAMAGNQPPEPRHPFVLSPEALHL